MKPKRKILSLLLAICLVAGLLPTTAFALDGDKTIMLGTSGISGFDTANGGTGYDYIYFGSWTTEDQYTTSGPIKWRVLDDQTNFDSDSDGTNDDGLFLLSDGLLGTGRYGGVYFQLNYHSANGTYYKGSTHTGEHTSCQIANTWQGSDAQTWCETFCSRNLTAQEQGAVLATTKSDKECTSSTYGTKFAASENILNGDKVFFLSVEEAENSSYGFRNDTDRTANYGNKAYYWWLRSPRATKTAGIVYYSGFVLDSLLGRDGGYGWAARPAFNLNLSSVLFTSAAEGGKSSGAVGADALQPVSEYAGNEWKLTLLDSTRNSFAISNATMDSSGNTISFSYSGAATGTNEYISAVVVDNGAITHYGRILQLESASGTASGTASLTLPADVTLSDTVKLYVFNEQYNGDKMTDYASQLCEVTFDTTAPTLAAGATTRDSETSATVKFTSNEAGRYYYVVDNNATAPDSIDTTTTAGTSCKANEETEIFIDSLSNGVQYIHIVVKDVEGNVSQPLTIQIPAYTFTVTVNVDPSEGGTASADPSAAVEGDEIELTASPNEGYHFNEWQVTPSTVSIGDDNKFTMPSENVTVKAVFEAHSFTQENTDNEYLVSSATCTQAATYYKSCSCGAKGTETFTRGEALGHTLGADWKYNGSTHWKLCVNCSAKVDEAAHVYDNEQDIICNACGYVKPTYAISASPETLDFGSATEGYSSAPAAQIVTITNTGNQDVTVDLPTSTNYTVTAGTGFTNGKAALSSGDKAQFTVQPKTGLGAGNYSETLTVSGSNGTRASVGLSFYTLTVNLNGGSSSGSTTYPITVEDSRHGDVDSNRHRAERGDTVTLTVTPDRGYVLDKLVVTDKDGDEIDVRRLSNGKYTFIMPRSAVTVEAVFTAAAAEGTFADVSPDAYYADAVEWAVANGITGGTSATTFSPNNACTRAQMVTFLWRAAGEPEPETSVNPFTDVAAGAYYYDAVLWAVEQGITNGTTATTFSPNATVTRAQTVTFLWRSEGKPAPQSAMGFTDVAAGAYYFDAVAWAVENGITNGTSAAAFSPYSTCTRAQIVTFIYRCMA